MIKIVLCGLGLVIGAVVVVSTVGYGLYKQEEVDCFKLQSQADAYPAFWLSQNDKDMCDAHGITINATVK